MNIKDIEEFKIYVFDTNDADLGVLKAEYNELLKME